MKDLSFAAFQLALLDMAAPLPADLGTDASTMERFAVHRHTCRNALIDALRAAYPAIVAAVGGAYFDALAAEFILCSPLQTPVLQEYSPAFAEFLQCFAPLAEWPWLSDVARIDWARREAYHAADAEALTAQQLQTMPVEALMRATLGLHPSLQTLDSAYPAWSLWHCQQDPAMAPGDDSWQAQSTQIWRHHDEILLCLISAGEALLRRRLANACPLGESLFAAHELDPHFDASTALATLIRDGLIVALHP